MSRPPTWFCPDDLRPDQKERLQRDWEQSMRRQRKFARENAERIAAEWDALEAPPLTISEHIAHARKLRLIQGDKL